MGNLSIFVDSGAHSIYNKEVRDNNFDYSYYETDKFWEYVDSYCKFIKANEHLVDVFVSVDVIYNPELSWKVQRYIEDTYKIIPMPVFHAGEDFAWFKKYLDNYEYIGIGGIGQQTTKSQWVKNMGDPVFSMICKAPDYLPTHKLHGFAMTAPSLLAAYPWYSVDSTSWIQFGKYGIIIVPKKINETYRYDLSPELVTVTSRPAKKGEMNHLDNVVSIHQDYFLTYFEEKGYIIGKSEFKTIDPKGYKLQENEQWAVRKEGLVEVILEKGLSNSHELRDQINLMFYLDLEMNLPIWPWPWVKKAKQTRLF
jgi:hypothetical protein